MPANTSPTVGCRAAPPSWLRPGSPSPVCRRLTATAAASPLRDQPPPVRHVFVINLENKGYDETFGPDSPAPYLAKTLRAKGQLLTQYYGIAHNSLPNYIAQISGQGPNPQTQGDCQIYSDFVAGRHRRAASRRSGNGCVYPARRARRSPTSSTPKGLTWRGYMEDMGTPCRHPAANAADDTQKAEGRRPVRRAAQPVRLLPQHHRLARCATNDVDLRQLPNDLATVADDPQPHLHHAEPLQRRATTAPCVDGRPGGLVTADQWLRTWVPKILASPAFKKDGLLVVTFDEADTGTPTAPTPAAARVPARTPRCPGIYGLGGGRTGTVLVSPFLKPGTLQQHRLQPLLAAAHHREHLRPRAAGLRRRRPRLRRTTSGGPADDTPRPHPPPGPRRRRRCRRRASRSAHSTDAAAATHAARRRALRHRPHRRR